MNILIVEDEPQILLALREFVEQSDIEATTVHTTDNAEDALQWIERCRPEMIITDIVLPRMDGLDMLARIQKEAYHPKVLVISSFRHFDYARKSLQLGAVDYMLKPLIREEVVAKIGAVGDMIRKESQMSERRKHEQPFARLGTETMKGKFLLSLCLNRTPLHDHIDHRLHVWELHWLARRPYRAMVLAKTMQDGGSDAKSDQDIHLQHFAIGNIAQELAAEYTPSVVLPGLHHDWIVLIAEEIAHEFLEQLASHVRAFGRMELDAGVSEAMHSFQAVHSGYEQARAALKTVLLRKDRRIAYYGTACDEPVDRAGTGAALAVHMLNDDKERIAPLVRRFLAGVIRLPEVKGAGDLSTKCFEMLLDLQNELHARTGLSLDGVVMQLWDQLDRCESVEDFEQLIVACVNEWTADIGSRADTAMENVYIQEARRIIGQSYADNINLASVAEQINIHPVWLSRLFKSETGQTFLEYLTNVRMEHAKALLRTPGYKVYEVAQLTGYQDLQYFGKVFKKRIGVTPNQYRQGKTSC